MSVAQIKWCVCKCRGGRNFGDVITPYIYHKLTGKHSVQPRNHGTPTDPVYFGAGSIMSRCKGFHYVVVWGTGVMTMQDHFMRPTTTLAVRGPLTRNRFKQLGYECPEQYGDIGLLLPRVYTPPVREKRFRVGIIPHYVDFAHMQKLFSALPGVCVIDLCNPVEQVIDEIVQCERTISTSLHGIIVSHAYSIPCAWARVSEKIFGRFTKYHDYYGSLEHLSTLPVAFRDMRPIHPDGEWAVEQFCEAVDEYAQPEFPINTDALWALCPFNHS